MAAVFGVLKILVNQQALTRMILSVSEKLAAPHKLDMRMPVLEPMVFSVLHLGHLIMSCVAVV